MTMPWRWCVQPSRAEADGVGGVDSGDGEGPLFAEMRCDLSVVRKNLEAGRAEVSVSVHTDQRCQLEHRRGCTPNMASTNKKRIASS